MSGIPTAASNSNNGERANAMDNRRLELRWGYGLAAFRDAFSLTPHLAVGLSPTERDSTLGWTLAPLEHNLATPSTTAVSLEVTRREPTAHHNAAGPHHSLGLQLDSRF